MEVCKKLESHVKKNKPEYEVYIVFKGGKGQDMIDGFIQETKTTFEYRVVASKDLNKYRYKNDKLKLPSLVLLNNGKVNEIWKEGKSGSPDFYQFD
jgi:oxalate decarboxylase/phosphoglucose isomerase-like protein (cupin superfamily)